jgi:hypothetical protein
MLLRSFTPDNAIGGIITDVNGVSESVSTSIILSSLSFLLPDSSSSFFDEFLFFYIISLSGEIKTI